MKLVLPRPPLVLAPVAGSRHFGHALLLAMAAITWAFGYWAVAKPMAVWRWIDIVSESAIVAMLALWLVQLRASRPAGRVTTWLCLGLSGMLLGGWADLMDEFWKLPRDYTLLMGMESTCHVVGMVGLTFGLHLWRQEQLALNALRAGRERGYREHAQIDGLTQLGDGAYLLDQIRHQQRLGTPATLAMLGWQDLPALARQHGLAEADRLLQATGPLLLLQLRGGDLLCRYAADRFVALLPQADAALPGDLLSALSAHVHPCADGRTRARLGARLASAPLDPDEDAEAQLLRLLERLR
ncbi:diguanylate cyclase [Mitsuaria sp. GD03876]|uniref:GGDEF domain-containing protein n=1 Tax=Mitsuaria sp. GD03876 TaxID=2975399 RepID=UPI00244C115F|nr:diguanylate cyclase [Mitsuaria sp. GD03876]MDH0863744.1 diguanylate cyclase [Mitsuaria sp. GD03876]